MHGFIGGPFYTLKVLLVPLILKALRRASNSHSRRKKVLRVSAAPVFTVPGITSANWLELRPFRGKGKPPGELTMLPNRGFRINHSTSISDYHFTHCRTDMKASICPLLLLDVHGVSLETVFVKPSFCPCRSCSFSFVIVSTIPTQARAGGDQGRSQRDLLRLERINGPQAGKKRQLVPPHSGA
jgi:hypothetical protein